VEEQKFVTPLSHLKALGVEVSLLMGLGKNVPLDEARGVIESGRILDYLHKDQGVDLNGWKKVQIDEINAEFQSMTAAIDERLQSGITEDNNGLAFVMAYILEGISNRTRPA
jgi:CHASE3 domain sensor protein